jgi:2Fe-2S ferredoxin
VVVEDGWIDQVGRSGPVEEEMLAMNPEREPNSRLSCQMRLSDSLDGLVVRLPEFQL